MVCKKCGCEYTPSGGQPRSHCSPCKREYFRDYYKKNPDKILHKPRKPIEYKTCRHCGVEFNTRLSHKSFCSNGCKTEWTYKSRKEKYHSEKIYIFYKKECHRCGKEFKSALKSKIYCSSGCRNYCRQKRAFSRKLIEVSCVCCGTIFKKSPTSSRVCCSNKCTRTIYKTKHRKQKLSHLCPECGKDTNRAKYCSIICLKRATNRNKAKSPARKLKANLRRPHSYGRCKRLGLPVEQVDPLRVFWRDKWKCQLCGTETPMSLRGTCNDKAPELDHINPISKGGGHTYENTQCLCRSCNAWKKDMPLVSYNVVLQARSEIRAIFGD